MARQRREAHREVIAVAQAYADGAVGGAGMRPAERRPAARKAALALVLPDRHVAAAHRSGAPPACSWRRSCYGRARARCRRDRTVLARAGDLLALRFQFGRCDAASARAAGRGRHSGACGAATWRTGSTRSSRSARDRTRFARRRARPRAARLRWPEAVTRLAGAAALLARGAARAAGRWDSWSTS